MKRITPIELHRVATQVLGGDPSVCESERITNDCISLTLDCGREISREEYRDLSSKVEEAVSSIDPDYPRYVTFEFDLNDFYAARA